MPLGQWVGKDGGDRREFDHLTFPNGGALEVLLGWILTLPTKYLRKESGGMVGHTIDRSIIFFFLLISENHMILSNQWTLSQYTLVVVYS